MRKPQRWRASATQISPLGAGLLTTLGFSRGNAAGIRSFFPDCVPGTPAPPHATAACFVKSSLSFDTPEPADRRSAALRVDHDLLAGLRLDAALHLLAQSGCPAPERDGRNPADWLQDVIDALCDLSSRDALTGLANRRQFELAAGREIDRVARIGEPTLMLVLDIDHFKRVNDTHGHLAGDRVIQTVARLLQDCVRPMDTVARVGGEEFAVILPNCQPAFGQAVAERIRQRIEAQPIAASERLSLPITVSIGGAYAPQWVRSSVKLWSERADQQLYRAKSEGRNRACLELPPLPMVSAEEKGLLFAYGSSDFTPLDPLDLPPSES